MTTPPPLIISHASKAYNGVPVLHDISLSVGAEQITALLGPSGCGKTTTLRLIAGFEAPDSGTITIQGRVVASASVRVATEDRRVGMVFQEYALFPHLSVTDNIAFGLKGNARDKQARVADVLRLVGLSGTGARMPYELSGGQQQRIALARALAPKPDLLLLDEPFSNLDATLRGQIRTEVRAILKAAGTTCVFVTHDQEEALSLADEVAVMLGGRVAQVAPPQTLYRRPATREVAAFVGEANFLNGEAQGATVVTALGRLPLREPHHGAVTVLLRPEGLRLSTGAAPATATVLWREYYGHNQRLGLRLTDGTTLVARSDAYQDYGLGEEIGVHVQGRVQVFARV